MSVKVLSGMTRTSLRSLYAACAATRLFFSAPAIPSHVLIGRKWRRRALRNGVLPRKRHVSSARFKVAEPSCGHSQSFLEVQFSLPLHCSESHRKRQENLENPPERRDTSGSRFPSTNSLGCPVATPINPTIGDQSFPQLPHTQLFNPPSLSISLFHPLPYHGSRLLVSCIDNILSPNLRSPTYIVRTNHPIYTEVQYRLDKTSQSHSVPDS